MTILMYLQVIERSFKEREEGKKRQNIQEKKNYLKDLPNI